MKNANDIITQKYFQLLAPACKPVPVFRDGYIPNDLLNDAYVMITVVSNVDNSTMNSADTITNVQVAIYTKSAIENNADVLNDTASKIFETIMPGYFPDNFSGLPGLAVLTTELTGDNSPAPLQAGADLYMNRFISFKHFINHSIN
jgi:hypothetical protein